MCMIRSVIQQPKQNKTKRPGTHVRTQLHLHHKYSTEAKLKESGDEKTERIAKDQTQAAIRGAESQRPRGIDDRLGLLPVQRFVLVAERGPVHPVVDVGQEVASLEGRRDELDPASVERVVQDGVAHLVALELGVEVAARLGLEGLVVGDAVLVVLADDADLGGADGLRLVQGPRAEVLAALAVDHALHDDLHGLGDGLFGDILVGRRRGGDRS
ncbi:hypothetical protein EUGRSUZ_G03080 [Eucalyptus grandis]|uniref:Uncharacterized protein n=2 Tax=Eucalyptus grandis TaxID=71139 RepID=A0ACC3KAT5_EUCGR|nr:hypothetical protein EUGRSUZ_G03080 [Eucalyptus grandis]